MTETPVETTVPDRGPRHRALSPRSWSRRARWIAAVVVVVVVVAIVLVWRAGTSSGATTPVLARASVGTLRETVGATGTIAPAQRADLDFAVSGRVTAVPVTVGQQVAAGDTLATVDAASLPQQVAQANANVAGAQARLDADSGASAAQRDADSAALTAAQAQLAVAQRNLGQATLTAPFAGTVAAVNVTAGQQVSAGGSSSGASGSSGGSGSGASGSGGAGGGAGSGSGASTGSSSGATADVVVISTGSFVVNATVDDTEVAKLKNGQTAEITPTGAAKPVAATVSSVGLVATSSSGVATYPVTLAVSGDTSALHAGASAQVSIVISQVDDAVLVPASAVHGTGANATVLVDAGGKQTSTKVTVGATDGTRTQILTGITAGTQVVVATGTPGATTTRGGGGLGGFGGGGGGGFRGGGGAGGGGPGGAGGPGGQRGAGGGGS